MSSRFVPTQARVVKAKDFAESGDHLAVVGDEAYRIYFDRNYGPTWYVRDDHLRPEDQRHGGDYVGYNKDDALEGIVRKLGEGRLINPLPAPKSGRERRKP